MKLVERYSHLNGWEYLQVHKPLLWKEIQQVIASVDAESCRSKVSKESRKRGKKLYSPVDMNSAMKVKFEKLGWVARRQELWVSQKESVIREILYLSPDDQKKKIIEKSYKPIKTSNQTDFVKDRVAVEVQFGKYAFVAHDLFVKHMAFYVAGIIDVGVEIVPMKELEQNMSSGVPYYERDLFNIIRQGRGVPAVPLILLGVVP